MKGRPKNKIVSFEEARRLARSLRLRGTIEWQAWAKTDARPKNIPSNPAQAYKSKFKGYRNFLGTTYTRYQVAKFYATASSVMVKRQWSKVGLRELGIEKPVNIPLSVQYVYVNQYDGAKSFLGTNAMPYNELKHLVMSLGIRSSREYIEHFREHPVKGVKICPNLYYSNWPGWKKFVRARR